MPRDDSRTHQEREANQSREHPLVLVADDEEIVALTLVDILTGEGFRAVAVNDGASAVESAHSLHPDVVLSDVAMPRMNGIEAAKRIRAFLPETRIILFSGYAETTELLAVARQQGHYFEVLAKPIHPEVLLRLLRRTQ
jgi:CheY-like chemotaxis protein